MADHNTDRIAPPRTYSPKGPDAFVLAVEHWHAVDGQVAPFAKRFLDGTAAGEWARRECEDFAADERAWSGREVVVEGREVYAEDGTLLYSITLHIVGRETGF
jgi:hypothetical protein